MVFFITAIIQAESPRRSSTIRHFHPGEKTAIQKQTRMSFAIALREYSIFRRPIQMWLGA
jgi:hypothetical protein